MNDNYNNDNYNNDNYNINNPYNNQHVNWRMAEDSPNRIYPTPEVKDEGKKKKGRFGRFIRLTAAALIFGIIAGIAVTGYHYFFLGGRDYMKTDKQENDEIEDSNLSESSDNDMVIYTDSKIDGIISDVSDIVDKVMPSIVSINATDIITSYDIFFGRRFNEPVVGSGSGIIIGQSDSHILIVTNNHVVNEAEKIEIVFADDSKAEASIKGTDSRSDLAVLEVAIEDLSEETLNSIKVARLGNSNNLKAGEMVIAIGNALGYGQSVTVGYISALERELNVQGLKMKLIQTDAAINPGNSGGALLNIYGEVIGINSVKLADTNVEGMGYAIPISDAIPMINLLMNNKALEVSEMGFFGINVETAQNVTEDLSKIYNIPVGIFINDVVEDSPAEKAGLKPGHIIVGFDDIKIETIDDLLNVLTYSRPGDEVVLKIKELNNGQYVEKELNVVLGKRPE
ncbi:MAG TPA: trypsin-like peptidase domain-containing protein [Mobilitalea sp.]|nr:trypsin-like peptidase domain-containing protein [Mobilitalea sp.]